MTTDEAKDKSPSPPKLPCRSCGHEDFHRAQRPICPFFKARSDGSYGPVSVLDSERVEQPERHAFMPLPGMSFADTTFSQRCCLQIEVQFCGQPRSAPVHAQPERTCYSAECEYRLRHVCGLENNAPAPPQFDGSAESLPSQSVLSPTPFEESLAVKIIDYLNFDTALPSVRAEVDDIAGIIAERLRSRAPEVVEGQGKGEYQRGINDAVKAGDAFVEECRVGIKQNEGNGPEIAARINQRDAACALTSRIAAVLPEGDETQKLAGRSSTKNRKGKTMPTDKGPERIWLDLNDTLRLCIHPHIAQGISAAINPDEESLRTLKPAVEYVRADLATSQAPTPPQGRTPITTAMSLAEMIWNLFRAYRDDYGMPTVEEVAMVLTTAGEEREAQK